MPTEITEIIGDLEQYFGKKVTNITALAGGNNSIHKVTLGVDTYVAKAYYADDRQRRDREYTGINFLNQQGFKAIPAAIHQNPELDYAVYSYIEGQPKPSSSFSRSDLDQVAQFISALHSLEPKTVDTTFRPGVMSCHSLSQLLGNINFRLGKFFQAVQAQELHPAILDLNQEYQFDTTVPEHIDKSLKEGSVERDDVDQLLTPEELRLSPVDLGPQNMIFRPDGEIVFLDFEYFGWDDPIKVLADFTTHEQSKGISVEDQEYFIQRYKEVSPLPNSALTRLDLIRQLSQIEWISIILFSVTPEKIRNRQFASSNFDLDTYINEQVGNLQRRLARFRL